MAQRDISERQVLIVLNGGRRVHEPAPAGASIRWRYSGAVDGRKITVIVAEEAARVMVITAY